MYLHRCLTFILFFASVVSCLAIRANELQYSLASEMTIEASTVEEGSDDCESLVSDDSEAICVRSLCVLSDYQVSVPDCWGNRIASLGFLGHRYRGPPPVAV
ncbi:MAG TPA: hypothetical protein DDZ51_16455 [Planctomycetaceae bacterium]|nr:hypothetical protein [Planctomycetaceae bacterium]